MTFIDKILYGFVLVFAGTAVSGSIFIVFAFIYSHITK
jgi:hypothetical protein